MRARLLPVQATDYSCIKCSVKVQVVGWTRDKILREIARGGLQCPLCKGRMTSVIKWHQLQLRCSECGGGLKAIAPSDGPPFRTCRSCGRSDAVTFISDQALAQ